VAEQVGRPTLIERGLTNYARVDICCIGGLTEAKKVAGWCEAHYIDMMPHNPIGPVCTAATIHYAASVNNLTGSRSYRRSTKEAVMYSP